MIFNQDFYLIKCGWTILLDEVNEFCDRHDISKLKMEDAYVNPQQQRKKSGITNKHHYQVDCFNNIIDWLLQELDSRFNETNSQLLVCSDTFSPRESFRDFDVESLISLAKLYPDDFGSTNLRDLRAQLNMYIADVREDNRFSNLNTISELAQKMVETEKKSSLCISLSTFKACTSAACGYCNSRKMFFGHEACEDISVQQNW